MDGVSTTIAVVSFTLQLVGTVKKATKFLKEVQNAPKEIARLVDCLSQFESLLVAAHDIVEQQNKVQGLPSSIHIISSALERCKSTIDKLDASVNALKAYFKNQSRGRKVWASLRTVIKQDEVEHIRAQVDKDMKNLHTALLVNMSHLQ